MGVSMVVSMVARRGRLLLTLALTPTSCMPTMACSPTTTSPWSTPPPRWRTPRLLSLLQRLRLTPGTHTPATNAPMLDTALMLATLAMATPATDPMDTLDMHMESKLGLYTDLVYRVNFFQNKTLQYSY